jgi:hypothetical protein
MVDGAAIAREVAEGMAEAHASLAEARQDIAEARQDILSETDLPEGARRKALAALDKAERDLNQAFARQTD